VRLEINPERLGSSRNFERAIQRCDSELIALADQDDVWQPAKLERLEAALTATPEIGLAISNADVVDRDLAPLGYDLWTWVGFDFARAAAAAGHRAPRSLTDTEMSGDAPAVVDHGFHLALMAGISFGITMAFRAAWRSWLAPIPDNRVELKSSLPLHDKWIAMLIAAVAPVALVPERLTLYRQHEDQLTGAAPMARSVTRGASPLDVPRRDMFERAAGDFTRLRAKVLAHPRQRLTAEERAELDDLIAHLEARARMPGSRLRRVPAVLRELGSGRYGRFGNGWRSAAKDIL
jgi:hypothetical protein